MSNCLPGEAKIVGRAGALDVTPEAGKAPRSNSGDADRDLHGDRRPNQCFECHTAEKNHDYVYSTSVL